MSTPTLTRRQYEVLELTADGLTAGQIARRLGLKADTVHKHSQLMQSVLGARNRANAVAIGFRTGLLAREVIM